MNRARFMDFAGFFISLAFSLAFAEYASRLWIPRQSDALQRARRTMVLDADLGWREASNLDTIFEGKILRTDAKGFRLTGHAAVNPEILVLGPSSAFGWGVKAEEAWPERLRAFNASQIGYTLVQGRKVYASLDADLLSGVKTVVIAYGVNEVDRFRFFGTDGLGDLTHFSRPRPVSIVKSGLNASAFGSLLWRAFEEGSRLVDCRGLRRAEKRMSPEEFGRELGDFVRQLRRDGKRVLFVNSAREMPFESDDARAALSDRLMNESAGLARAVDCAAARKLLGQARENEPWRVLRDIDMMNRLIDKAGRDLSVPVVDIASALVTAKKGEWFVDPIHPSSEGHAKIAGLVKLALDKENSSGRQF